MSEHVDEAQEDKSGDPEHPLYARWNRPAETVKIVGQMLVGLSIPFLVAAKICFWFVRPAWAPVEFLRQPLLSVVGTALAVSAGLELAYMLFTPGPDEAIEPLILGLSAAALIVAAGDVGRDQALAIAILALSIALLFWIRRWGLHREAR